MDSAARWKVAVCGQRKGGARSQLSLVFASVTIAIVRLFLTGLMSNLPQAVLAAIVLVAI